MRKPTPRQITRAGLLLGALFALSLVRCGAGAEGGIMDPGGDPNRRAVGLRLTPTNEILFVDLNQEATQDFTVTVLYDDQSAEIVSARAQLTTSNGAAGRFEGAIFRAARSAASKVEFTTITATYAASGQTFRALANLTLVWLRTSGPAQDFFFTLPYQGGAQKKPLSFSTLIQSLDTFFAVDTTGSMAPAITQLRDSLRDKIIPAVNAAAVRGSWFGVGAVEDFPVDPYGKATFRPGYPDDQPFILLNPQAMNPAVAQAAVDKLLVGDQPRGQGGDVPEGQIEALYQIASGAGNVVAGVVDIPANKKGIGGAEFRAGALPIVTLITDAMFHTKGEPAQSCTIRTTNGVSVAFSGDYAGATLNAAHSRAEATAALNRICAKVIGVSVLRTSAVGYMSQPEGLCNATQDLTTSATASGALVPPQAFDLPQRPAGCAAGKCCTGLGGVGENPNGQGLCPLVFKVAQEGTGLGAQVTSGITQVARFSTFEVVTSTSGVAQGDMGERLPAGRTTADFLRSVLPLDAMAPPAPPIIAAPVITGDRFTGVTPGSLVRFTIEARNDFQPASSRPQVFHATIKISAGGCADLDQRDVLILIPPAEPTLG